MTAPDLTAAQTAPAAVPAPGPTGEPAGESVPDGAWVPVCGYDELVPGRGVAALVDGVQVAIFRDGPGAVYAVGNQDPFSGAYVIARGLVGSRGDTPTVASPMYKQVFDLRTGHCLDDASVALPVHQVRIWHQVVQVAR